MGIDIYGGRDPRDIPAYGLKQAAHILDLPQSTLRNWVRGWSYPTQAKGKASSPPLIELPRGADGLTLSFNNVIEAHVLSAIRRAHGVKMRLVRKALDYLVAHMGVERPLVSQAFKTDGVDLFVEHLGAIVNVSSDGQLEIREVIDAYLDRVARAPDGVADRLYPFTRGGLDDPRFVVINPRVSFGRPMIERVSVPTDIIASRFSAGDSHNDLMDDFGCSRDEVDEAIRYELRRAA